MKLLGVYNDFGVCFWQADVCGMNLMTLDVQGVDDRRVLWIRIRLLTVDFVFFAC